jgi:dihydrodipicolinate synthase/N-acetylneuraminate lyase
MYRMRGVVPPMVTPFKENGDLDEDGLRTLVGFLKEHVQGLFICGSYGCGPLMSSEERKRVAEIVTEVNQGKVDVIVHVGTTFNQLSMDLARHASSIGAQAIAAVGPYYYQHQDDSVLDFYRDLVTAAGSTPVYVYNNPRFQGYPMRLELIQQMKEAGVHGIKDATFDIITHATYHRVLGPDFDISLGTEAMFLPAAVLGTRAFIPGIGNVFPEMNYQMFEEAEAGNYDACRETQFRINRLRDIMYLARSTQLAVYAMLSIRGIVETYPRKPFIPASKDEIDAMRRELKQLGAV